MQLHERLNDHRNSMYRAKHRSIHYYLWDIGQQDKDLEVEEKFVFLANLDGINPDPLFLNIMEMWCCLMLQTLPVGALKIHLPDGTLSPAAGGHLNIGKPLFQTTRGDIMQPPSSLYHSDDPLIKEYYASLRQNYYSLKSSLNPVLRELYKLKTSIAQDIRAQKCRDKSAQRFLQGMHVKISVQITEDRFKQRFTNVYHIGSLMLAERLFSLLMEVLSRSRGFYVIVVILNVMH